jgi:hypothetical protein
MREMIGSEWWSRGFNISLASVYDCSCFFVTIEDLIPK